MKKCIYYKRGENDAKIITVALSVVAVIVGALYIAAACHIFYTGGDDPYSRERVGEYLAHLIIPSLLLIIYAVISAVICAGKEEKLKAEGSASYALARAKKKNPTYTLDENTRAIASAESRRRLIYKSVTAAVTVLLLGAALIFALNRSQYKNVELTNEVVGALSAVLPLAASAIGMLAVCSYLCESSSRRELSAHLLAVKEKRFSSSKAPEKSLPEKALSFFERNDKKVTLILRIVIGVCAAALIIFGALAGGMADVLAKAIKICTECIGLG